MIEFKFDPKMAERLARRLNRFSFDVGILEDKAHRLPKTGKKDQVQGSYAGGPVRKLGKVSNQSVSDVSKSLRDHLGFNYLTKPFEKITPAAVAFLTAFFRMAFSGRSEVRRVENALQAVVRNPILRGDYGPNSRLTQKIKGFDRFGIDTGQLFKAIKAQVKAKHV